MSNIKTTMGILSRIAPRTTAQISSLLFTLPHRVPRPARERLVLESARSYRMKSLGVPLQVWEWGEGPVVLLAHGWAGRGSQLGAFVQPLVQGGYKVIAFDQPAHGDSGGRTASLHAFAENIRTLAEASGGVHAVIAHSFGAMATNIAIRRGLEVNRLVFVGPAAWTDNTVANWAAQYGVTASVVGRVRRASEQRYGIRWDDLLGRNLGRGMRTPLLLVHDEDDSEIPRQAVEDLAGSWEGSQLVWTAGFGHNRILRAPMVVAQAAAFVTTGQVLSLEEVAKSIDPWAEFLHDSKGRVA
ncbi:MAG: alpha/beta fold hydrolase [Deltaproteobacteria bacterium]|nr:alpha/beta fold hydrolase [Deltaproteobacteria bacterium]